MAEVVFQIYGSSETCNATGAIETSQELVVIYYGNKDAEW